MKKLKDILDIAIFIAMRSLIRIGKQSLDEAHDRVVYALIFPLLPLLGCSGPLLFHISKEGTMILAIIFIIVVFIPLSVYVSHKERWRRIYERYSNTNFEAKRYSAWFWIYFLFGPIICIALGFYMAMRNNGDLPEWLIFN